MADDTNILPSDQNFVRAAGFESSSTPGLVMAGQIDEVTGRILVDNAGSGGSSTLLAVSTASTTAPNSIYNLTAGIPVIFKSSDGNTMFYLDETNERIGIGTASPTTKLDVRGDFYTGNGTNGFTFSSNGITPQINGFILVDNASNREFAITNTAASLNYLKVDNTLTGGRLLSGIASAASKSAMLFNGAWYASGTGTTTFPHLLLEATGTTASTAWSTSGTGLGINAVTGFAGNFIDMKTAGTTVYRFASNGQIVFGTSGSAMETGSELDLRAAGGGGGLRGVRFFTNSALSSTTGTVYTAQTLGSFAAGAGTANYRAHTVEYTINNSGSQSGIATGLYINATETALNSMTHNLMDLQVGGSSKFKVNNAGAVTSGTIISNSTIEAGAGNSLRWTSRSRMNSISDGSILFSNSASNDFSLLQFGGTTSSFPALKRSSATLEVKLADDSAYAVAKVASLQTVNGVVDRVVTTTDDATAVIDVTVTDTYELSAIANNTTFSTTGTPVDGQSIVIRYKDAGVSKTLTWDAVFVAIGVTLPTATTASKWGYVGCKYNSAAGKFHVLAVTTEA